MTLTAGELAGHALSGRLDGPAELPISGIAGLDDATSDQVTFIANARHAHRWGASRAGAAIVTDGVEPTGHDSAQRSLIFVPNAELAVIEVLHRFDPGETRPEDGVHPSAAVHPSARIDKGARIGACATVGAGAVIEDGVVIWPGVHVYPEVTIGAGSVLHAGAVIRSRTSIGRNVVIHPNVTIGSDGFGYRPSAAGPSLVKMPHIGKVVIEDDVEIGANSCVDRGKFGATRIGAGTKIDNLVQIGHNVLVGRNCVITAATSIGGSTRLGDGVVIGGASAVRDHIEIGEGAMIGGRAGVTCDVPAGAAWTGFPAGPAVGKLREWAAQRKLPGLIRELTAIARRGSEAAISSEKRDAPDHG